MKDRNDVKWYKPHVLYQAVKRYLKSVNPVKKIWRYGGM